MRWFARLFVALMGLTLVSAGVTLAAEVEVLARKINSSEAPKIDGKMDKVWGGVRATKVMAAGGPQGKVKISLKVLYTDTDVYFLFRWPDKTKSLNRLYEFDGKEWKKVKGNEDRFNLVWDIHNTVKDFPERGCMAVCHVQDRKLALKTKGPDQHGDIWHWKAQRSNPAGYADDQWLGHELKQKGHETTARGNDSKTAGGYARNFDKDTRRPKYTFKEGVKPGPMLLRASAVEIRDYARFKAGARLPREVLAKPVGSRGDIEAKAVWAKRRWTLEMKRARDTGDTEHDVQFTDSGRPYYFAISIHDNADEYHHAHTGVTALKLLLK
ncbi:MAG: ethylbenzene dehydrogenase-related protein [Candidatus Methylomirabilia bacterium]